MTQHAKQRRLARFHSRRVGSPLMIVALQMQHAVDDEVRAVGAERLSLRPRLPRQDRDAQYDVAGQRVDIIVHERQHVGGVLPAAEACVETAAFALADEAKRHRKIALLRYLHPAAQRGAAGQFRYERVEPDVERERMGRRWDPSGQSRLFGILPGQRVVSTKSRLRPHFQTPSRAARSCRS
jgi:hypothetical protein